MGDHRADACTPSRFRLPDSRTVLLTHYIPLYQVRVFQELSQRLDHLEILLSTKIEPNRQFTPDWQGLNVAVQNSLTLRRRWRHRAGFDDDLFVHVPYDTWSRIRKIRPRLIVSLELGFRTFAAALYRGMRRDCRLVAATYMSEHTEQGRGMARHLMRRWLIRRCDVVTYNGPSCYRYLRALGVPENRLYPLGYAADDRTAYRGPLRRSDEARRRFLYVGQLSQRKGVVPMLQQFARFAESRPERRYQLRIAGTGPLREELQRFPLPRNLEVEFLGNVPADQLAGQLQQCGMLILPTLADEWALVVNEALQAGMPIVGSCLAQACEVLVDERRTGWRYDPRDTDGLASVLEKIDGLADDAIEAMRDACRAAVESRTPRWAAEHAIQALQAAQRL